jgi:hypothetical protein
MNMLHGSVRELLAVSRNGTDLVNKLRMVRDMHRISKGYRGGSLYQPPHAALLRLSTKSKGGKVQTSVRQMGH